MVFAIDVTILYLISAVSLFFFTLGIAIGRKDQNVMGIIVSIIGALIWISLWSLADSVYIGYQPPQISNTTETGGTTVCTPSGGSTSCTVSAIAKSFSYINSTGGISKTPDTIPDIYHLQGIEPTGKYSENFYIKIYMIGFGIVLLFIGAFQYNFAEMTRRLS